MLELQQPSIYMYMHDMKYTAIQKDTGMCFSIFLIICLWWWCKLCAPPSMSCWTRLAGYACVYVCRQIASKRFKGQKMLLLMMIRMTCLSTEQPSLYMYMHDPVYIQPYRRILQWNSQHPYHHPPSSALVLLLSFELLLAVYQARLAVQVGQVAGQR